MRPVIHFRFLDFSETGFGFSFSKCVATVVVVNWNTTHTSILKLVEIIVIKLRCYFSSMISLLSLSSRLDGRRFVPRRSYSSVTLLCQKQIPAFLVSVPVPDCFSVSL